MEYKRKDGTPMTKDEALSDTLKRQTEELQKAKDDNERAELYRKFANERQSIMEKYRDTSSYEKQFQLKNHGKGTRYGKEKTEHSFSISGKTIFRIISIILTLILLIIGITSFFSIIKNCSLNSCSSYDFSGCAPSCDFEDLPSFDFSGCAPSCDFENLPSFDFSGCALSCDIPTAKPDEFYKGYYYGFDELNSEYICMYLGKLNAWNWETSIRFKKINGSSDGSIYTNWRSVNQSTDGNTFTVKESRGIEYIYSAHEDTNGYCYFVIKFCDEGHVCDLTCDYTQEVTVRRYNNIDVNDFIDNFDKIKHLITP